MSSASRLSDLLEMHHRRATKQSEGLSPLACCELQFDMSSCRAHVGSPVGQRITGDGQGDLPSPWRLLAQRPGAARNGMVAEPTSPLKRGHDRGAPLGMRT
jgi:hypothetical protein